MGKTVLILGNGFDLAHGLPTKYSDFLDFCSLVRDIKDSIKSNIECSNDEYNRIKVLIRRYKYFSELLEKYYDFLLKKEGKSPKYCYSDHEKTLDIDFEKMDISIDKIYNLLNNNIWYSYFAKLYSKKANKIRGNNWIDFESEISFVIETIDKHVKNLSHNWYIVNDVKGDNLDFPTKFKTFRTIVDEVLMKKPGDVKNVRKRLYDDLNNIIGVLEVYLYEFMEKYVKPSKFDLFYNISPDYIINFNYTHTYQNVYKDCNEVFYIHGELNHEPNNMVLGIDEYWPKKKQKNHTNFTIFKKFAQRIQKRTGVKHIDFYNKLKNDIDVYTPADEQRPSKVYIFGHSLDVTDKDILKLFLNDDDFEVTIFCRNEETEGEYIANVIKIIGEKHLLEKVNQDPPKLKFVIQQDMVPIEEEEKELSTSGAAK